MRTHQGRQEANIGRSQHAIPTQLDLAQFVMWPNSSDKGLDSTIARRFMPSTLTVTLCGTKSTEACNKHPSENQSLGLASFE